MTREGDYAPRHLEGNTSAELMARADIANKFNADLMVSIHFNAFNTTAHGVEALDYDGNGIGHAVAQTLVNILAKEEGLTNRGVKATNKSFAVIRSTNCPSIITESAFVDNPDEIAKFDEAHEWDKLAMYHYRAICAGFNLTPNVGTANAPTSPQKPIYRLFVASKQVDSYTVKGNAFSAGWHAYNSGSKDATLVSPEGYKYTFDLHQYENPVKPKPDAVLEAINVLVAKGVIASSDYWAENAREGKIAEGKWVGQLIINMANKLNGGV